MREFMTKVSEYISERRNDPEKNGNFLIPCMLGIVILIIIILCLLLLWRKNANGKEEELTAETYEYIPEVVMAEPFNDEELKQESLNNMQYLEEKVENLLQSLTEIQESLEETIISQQGDNVYLQEQVNAITEDIKNMITQLQNTQNNLYDITDMINIMNKETIPVIQEQISEMEKQINQVNIDIADIYSKMEALETTDTELKAKIDEIEGNIKSSMEELTAQFLRYRYEKESNTLYLYSD